MKPPLNCCGGSESDRVPLDLDQRPGLAAGFRGSSRMTGRHGVWSVKKWPGYHSSRPREKPASLSPDDFIFENEDGGFLDTDNFRKRVLHKIARKLRLLKLTFQVIGRTITTLAQKEGTIDDVQAVMRHLRTATTADVHTQEIPASVQSTINTINSDLRKSGGLNRKAQKELAKVSYCSQ